MDNQTLNGLLIGVGLLFLLASGLWIFAAMLVVSILGLFFLEGFTAMRIGNLLQPVLWRYATSFELAALPLFVWMAEILFRTPMSEQIFRSLGPWMNRVPGQLLHVVVLACGMFGTVCGSSAATCATISKIALPELKKRGYEEKIVLGSLCAGGTLGILLPPSIPMVIYAVAAEVSLVKLMLAGFLPGLVLMILFSLYIVAVALIKPAIAPRTAEQTSFRERVLLLKGLLPVSIFTGFIFISLFAGWVTATECAAWGVVGALISWWHSGLFTWSKFLDSLSATVSTSCMMIILIASAGFVSSFMAITGIPSAVAGYVGNLGLSPFSLIAMITVIYIVLGMFLDGVSMILLTLPLFLPIVVAAGFDPIWFGIFLVINIELAALSPPVGFNLFVLNAITRRDIFYIAWASLPFFVLMLLALAMFTYFPQIVMVVPDWYAQ